MTDRGFVRGRCAARVLRCTPYANPELSKFRARLRRTASLIAIAASTSAISSGALAAGLTIGPGATHNVIGPEVYDFLSMAPTSTLNFGNSTANDLQVNDNGVDTTWSGTIKSTTTYVDKDDQYLVKNGNGTVTLQDLNADGTEIHISNGTIRQTSGTNTLFILNVGSNVPAAGTGTFNISGGTLNITGGAASPFPAMQVGHFGGTGIVNQSAGNVNFSTAAFNIGNQGGSGTYNLSGGTITVTGGSAVTIGRSGAVGRNSVGILNISGGLFDNQQGDFVIGNNTAGGAGSASNGTINQTGGTLRIGAAAGLWLAGYNPGTYNLNGGTLEIGGTNLHGAYLGSGTPTFNLGGGTIKVIGSALNTTVNATLVGGSTSTIDTNSFGATWGGTLSGAGNLTKAGAGTLTFNTSQAYTGATNIGGGTLALSGSGSLVNSSGIALSNNGIFDISAVTGTSATIKDLSGNAGTTVALGTKELRFGTANSTTFNGDFSGTIGTLRKQGSGTFTFGGTSNSQGQVGIASGVLRMGRADAFTNATSPTLAIFGNPGATWDLGGAGHQKIGQLNIGGGGQTHVAMTLGNGHDFIQSTQALSLDGFLDIHTGDGNWTPSATGTTIMTGVLNRNGAFTAVTDDLFFLDASVVYPNATDVAVKFSTNSNKFQDIATTPNQTAAGTAIYSLGLGNPVFNGVATHNGADALALIDDLSGDFHASTKSYLVQTGQYLAGAAGDRLDVALGGGLAGGAAPLAYGEEKKDSAAWPAVMGAPKSGPGMWVQGYGHTIKLADSSGNAGLVDGNHLGLLGGIDGGWEGRAAGIGGGYSAGKFDSASRGASGNVKSFHAVAYGGAEVGALDVRVGGAYSFNSIDTTRTVALPTPQTLVASYKARTAQAFGEIGADMGGFKPFAGANYINVATDAFTETGGSAALSAAAGSQSVTFTTLGVRLQSKQMDGAVFRAMAGWRHAFGDVTPLSNLTIQGVGYTVAGVPIAKDAFVGEAGVDVRVSESLTLGASYSGQFSADAQDHGVKGTASVKF